MHYMTYTIKFYWQNEKLTFCEALKEILPGLYLEKQKRSSKKHKDGIQRQSLLFSLLVKGNQKCGLG